MGDRATSWLPWRTAMTDALYGPAGFYRVERPAAHFRTSVHTSALFAGAIARLAREVDDALGGVGEVDVVDVGCGRAELLVALDGLLPPRFRLIGVDLVARPDLLPARIQWRSALPAGVRGLLLANEWLDNVPLDVVEVDEAGASRCVVVDPVTGAERLGAEVRGAEAAWVARHWPLEDSPPGSRAEVGLSRDQAWVDAVSRLEQGLAVAVDYHHRRDSRPPLGTLTGYRAGHQVPPVPDGSCDLTAHVALDAAAAAVDEAAGTVVTSSIRSQRDVLRALGVRGDLPPRESAAADPAGYVRRLAAASEAAALTAPDGFGSFGWLAHARGVPLPPALGG